MENASLSWLVIDGFCFRPNWLADYVLFLTTPNLLLWPKIVRVTLCVALQFTTFYFSPCCFTLCMVFSSSGFVDCTLLMAEKAHQHGWSQEREIKRYGSRNSFVIFLCTKLTKCGTAWWCSTIYTHTHTEGKVKYTTVLDAILGSNLLWTGYS